MGFVSGCFPAAPGFPAPAVLFQRPGSLSRLAAAPWIVLTVLLHLPGFWVALHWTASLPSNTCSAMVVAPSPPQALTFTCPDGPGQCRNVILETLPIGSQAEILPHTVRGLVLTQVKTNRQTCSKVTRGSAFSLNALPALPRGDTEPCRWSLPARNMPRRPKEKWISPPRPGNSSRSLGERRKRHGGPRSHRDVQASERARRGVPMLRGDVRACPSAPARPPAPVSLLSRLSLHG